MMKKIFRVFAVCIGMIMVMFSAAPAASAYTSPDYEAIDAQLKQDVENFHIPGMSVVVVSSDEVLFSGTYGNCTNINTPFIIGSLSKSFTALSVMQLVERGAVELDAPISEYLDCSPYFVHPEHGDKITVKQLLNHASGLDTYQRLGRATITENYGKFEYANVNYDLLGKVIEAVSGESYSDYVERNIFAPLGMEKSSAALEESKADGLIAGYRNYFGVPIAGEPDYPTERSWSHTPAGYISSGAEDMGKYLQMYLNGGKGIISEESINAMFYDCVPQRGIGFYGMGWERSYAMLNETAAYHTGLVENYTSRMYLLPSSDIGIVILINTNDYLVTNNVIGNITAPLLGRQRYTMQPDTYWRQHILLDAAYLAVLLIALAPILFLNKWKKQRHGKISTALDIIVHLILPTALICIPYMLGVPLWVVYYYVKDLFLVLMISAVLLAASGAYKLLHRIRSSNKL